MNGKQTFSRVRQARTRPSSRRRPGGGILNDLDPGLRRDDGNTPAATAPRETATGRIRRFGAFLLLLVLAPPLWAGVQARLERSTIYDGDTVTLTIEAEGGGQKAAPDLSVLDKDFDVLGTSETRQISIVNGRRSDKHLWHVELDPRHKGTLTVPPVKVGRDSTRPLTLKVVDQPASTADGGDRPVFMKTEIEPAGASPWVQQQVLYTVRLYYRVPLVEGSFSELQPKNAVVEQLGEDRQYQTTIDGQPYQVIERRYAIFPEKSGTLEIPAVSFNGRLMAASGRRYPSTRIDSMMDRFFGGKSPFDDAFFAGTPFGNPGKRVRVRSRPLTLEVKARPASYDGNYWLPTADLELSDSWAEGPPEFRVGEPVTRTITLEAKGLEASQIPDIRIPDVSGVRLYPEQAETANHTDGEWVYGTRRQSVAYVATRPGTITLPEIRVDWWDTAAHKQRSSVIPAWQVKVLPGAGGSTTAPPPQITPAAPPEKEAAASTAAGTAQEPGYATLRDYGVWLVAGTALLLIAGFLVLRRRRKNPAVTTATTGGAAAPSQPSATELRRALQRACDANDARAAERALLDRAALEWPDNPPRNLGALALRLENGADEVRELERALYGSGEHEWNGSALWSAFRDGMKTRQTRDSSGGNGLSPLYPRWS